MQSDEHRINDRRSFVTAYV